MQYVLLLQGKVVALVNESPYTGTPAMKEFPGITYDKALNTNGHDMRSFAEAEQIAAEVTALTGKTYLPFDDGPGTSHQFGIVEAPKIGDEVSRGFNGDYYPCGKIVRITPKYKVITEDGSSFNRKRQTAAWKEVNGSFWMVNGIHDERNPSF